MCDVGYADNAKAYRLWSPTQEDNQKQRCQISENFSDPVDFDDFIKGGGEHHRQAEADDEESMVDLPLSSSIPEVDVDSSEPLNAEETPADSTPDSGSNLAPIAVKCGPGPTVVKTGKRGRPRKIYNLVPCDPVVEDSSAEFAGVCKVPIQEALTGPHSEPRCSIG